MSDSRLKMYARTASGAAALAAAGAANAAIITSTGPMTITKNAPVGTQTLFAFGSIGVAAANNQFGAWSTNGWASAVILSSQSNNGFAAMAISYGATIDTGLTGNPVPVAGNKAKFQSSATWMTASQAMALGTDNLLALTLSSGSQTYFGWINFSLSRSQGEYSFHINSWAYNDVAGQGIIAGQNTAAGSAVVPGLSGLAALAIGAAGVRTRRQRIA